MSGTHIKDFTQGNISKQLVTFAWPLFLSNLMQVVYNMVDMIVVGKVLGKAGLSAVAVGGDVSHFLTFVSMGFANAGQVIIARYIGAKQRDKIGAFVGTMGSFLMVILSRKVDTFCTRELSLKQPFSATHNNAAA